MGLTVKVVLACCVAAVAIFFAVSPSTEWENDHFTDEPFEWPESLQYSDVKSAASDGLILHTIVAGPPADKSKGVVVFAHGFPETAASWKDYILHYAKQGYHVRAPDMRNVNNSIAQNTDASLDIVADDLLGVLQTTGQSKTVIVGHDWGAGASWAFALKYPQHTTALVTLAVPHLELYRSYNTFRLPLALTHVWYFLFFGLTGPVARWRVVKDDCAWSTKFCFGTSEPQTFSKAEIARLKKMYARTMSSSSSSTVTTWYSMGCWWLLKSLLPKTLLAPGLSTSMWSDGNTPSRVPTLQLFGSRDAYINPSMFGHSANAEYVAHPYKRTVVYDATHWLNHEKKREIMQEMDSFIAGFPQA
eukprot:TRINITY_DN22759_c0_g1_i1.p1 TRINITY_DN22759_c0_g1~~TRINITY_DN22759_c0_g1_i1.p1  ORF type:complete len:369 (-),score=39.48 TRINITY_DN22759_c0_g1_i1:165-1244(-)